jgi:hypothetical protein
MSAILNFWQSYGHLKIASLYGDCMKPGCIGKSNTNNLPAPTDLTENPHEKNFFSRCNSKIGHVGTVRNCNGNCTNVADFWKMSSSSRKRGGADQNLHIRNRLSRTVFKFSIVMYNLQTAPVESVARCPAGSDSSRSDSSCVIWYLLSEISARLTGYDHR